MSKGKKRKFMSAAEVPTQNVGSDGLTAYERYKKYQAEYYKNNKKTLTEYRAKKYRSDSEYRENAINRSKQQYWFKTRPAASVDDKPQIELGQLEPLHIIEFIVDNPVDRRHGKKVKVPVFTTNALAELLGRTAQTIRLWERNGVISPPFYKHTSGLVPGRNARLYTLDEMRVVETAIPLFKLPSETIKDGHFAKLVRQGFKSLVQGIAPAHKKLTDE